MKKLLRTLLALLILLGGQVFYQENQDTQRVAKAVAETSISINITESRGDGTTTWNGSAWGYNSAFTNFLAGYFNATNQRLGGQLFFQNVNLPAGANITTANVTRYATNSDSNNTVNTVWTAENNSAPIEIITTGDYQQRRGSIVGGSGTDNITSANVTEDSIAAWTEGVAYDSPDLATIIQELVDRHGAITNIRLFWDDHEPRGTQAATTLRRAATFDNGTYIEPVLNITYTSDVPSPTSVSPRFGSDVGGDGVTVTGTNFQAGANVTFDGVLATNIVLVSSTTITCDTPAGTANTTANVTIIQTGGNNTLPDYFYYIGAQPNVSTVDDDFVGNTYGSLRIPWQGKIFRAAGRNWIFYEYDENSGSDSGSIYFSSTADNGVTWSTPTFYAGISVNAFKLATYYDGTNLAVIYADYFPDNEFYYRRGVPSSNGSIIWDNDVVDIGLATGNNSAVDIDVAIDTNGYEFIAIQYASSDNNSNDVRIVKNTNNDGTWVTDWTEILATAYDATILWATTIEPLTDGKMYATWGQTFTWNGSASKPLFGKLWDGDSWGAAENVSSLLLSMGDFDMWTMTTINDDVHLAFTRANPTSFQYVSRDFSTSNWSAEVEIDAGFHGSAAPMIRNNETDFAVFWLDDDSDVVNIKKNIGGSWDADFTVTANETENDGIWQERAIVSYGDDQGYLVGYEIHNSVLPRFLRVLDYGGPTLTIDAAASITITTATLSGDITALGASGDNATEWGFDWGLSSGNYSDNSTNSGSVGISSFSANLTGLIFNTTYFARSKGYDGVGWGYSAEISFSTDSGIPTVTTSAATSVSSTTATGNGNITNIGGATPINRRIEWDIDSGAPYANSVNETGSFGTGAFSLALTGLPSSTTIYARAGATNSGGTGYGGEVTFITTSAPSDFDSATFFGIIQVSNNSSSVDYTDQQPIVSINTTNYINGGWFNASANDTAILFGGSDIAFMPGFDDSLWSIHVPSIDQDGVLNYTLYNNSSDGKIRYFPGVSGANVTDNGTLELSDNFSVSISGFFDAASIGTLFNKASAFRMRGDGSGNITTIIANTANTTTTSAETSTEGEYVEIAYSSRFVEQVRFRALENQGQTDPIHLNEIQVFDDESSAWVSPISGSGTGWTGVTNAFDGNTGTTANATATTAYTNYITLVLADALNSSKLRFWYTDPANRYSTVDTGTLAYTAAASVTASGVSTGEVTITATANTSHFWLEINAVNTDNVTLSGANVTDNTANWTIAESAVMPYMQATTITIDGTLAGSWKWQYGTTFSDLSANSNTMTPSFRAANSNANVTARLLSWLPVTEAQAPPFSVADPDPWVSGNITVTGNFSTTVNATYPGADVIEEIAEAGETPVQLPTILLSGVGILALSLFTTWFLRKNRVTSLMAQTLILAAALFVLVAMSVIDSWMVYLFLMIAIAIVMANSTRTFAGTGATGNNLVGFLMFSFVGMTWINRILEGRFLQSDDVDIINNVLVFQPFSFFGLFTIPVPNASFLINGIPALIRWDYGFFGGDAQIIQYLLYSVTAVMSFILFVLALGAAYQMFSRGR